MHLLGFKRYVGGYTGFIVTRDRYAYFQVRRGAPARILKEYRSTDFQDRHHFKAVMSKFVPASRFLPVPLELRELSVEALERVAAKIKKRTSNVE